MPLPDAVQEMNTAPKAEIAPNRAAQDILFMLPFCPPQKGNENGEPTEALFLRFLQQVASFLCYGKGELSLLGSTLPHALLHPDDFASGFQFIHRAATLGAQGIQQAECRFRQANGEWRWVLCKQFAVPSAATAAAESKENENPGHLLIYLCDTTESRSREERLRLLESVVINANDVILITQAEPIDLAEGGPRVVYINDAFTRMTGYAPEDILGKTPRLLQGPETNRETCRFIREKLEAWEGFRAELLNYKKDGTPFWVELNVQPVCDEDGWYTHWIAVQRETTGRRQIELEREKLLADALDRAEKERLLAQALDRADRDPLTNLFNHRAFHERLVSEAECAALYPSVPRFVVLLDLDNFKFFNDAYGHLTGDAVLRRLAGALQEVCRPGDVLARMGGDEFAIMGRDRTPREASVFLESIKNRVGNIGYCPPGYDTPIPLTVSGGLAFFGDDSGGVVPIEVLKVADERLLRDKVGNQDYHIERLREQLKETVEGFAMLDALVTAVDNKDRYTRRHSEEVLLHSVDIARALGFSRHEIAELQVAALLHDVGKIGVPDRILRMPGKLSGAEYEAIKQHAAMGSILVGSVPDLKSVVDTVHFHHEKWDGSGYPRGLAGEFIPLAARVLAVADAYSAMTADRPYRKGMTPREAQKILAAGANEQWDARCVRAFLNAQQEHAEGSDALPVLARAA